VVAVDRQQVVAYRVQAHGLHRTAPDVASLGVLDLGVQYLSVPATQQALAARVAGDQSQDACVTVWSFRGAPHLLRRADVPRLAAELWPRTDADALTRLGTEAPVLRKSGVSGLTAFEKTARALRDIVTTELPKGEVSAAITKALPPEYAYECRGCKATHVYNALFQSAGLAAGVELRPGTRPTILAPLADRPPHPTPASATRVLRAYLRLHGPATLAEAAAYLGTTQTEAKPMWPSDLAEVEVDGQTKYLPEEDVPALLAAPAPDVVRLLPAFDPLLQLRDRELLVPNDRNRKAVWRILGNPGAVLAGGEIAGTWRTTKSTKSKLTLAVTPFGKLPTKLHHAIETEAERLAELRGAATATVEYE
jgi:hypothetical protein